jgi:hypothetical protein
MQCSKAAEQARKGDLATHPHGGSKDVKEKPNG